VITPPRLETALQSLEKRVPVVPRIHLILGSGLGGLAGSVEQAVEVPFDDVPGLPEAGVAGHAGTFIFGRIAGAPVLVQSGRYHYYEGWSGDVIGAPVRLGRRLGAEALVVTNAAGGIRHDLTPGSIMVIDDHLNLQFRASLAGPIWPGEGRFPDMSAPYDRALIRIAEEKALAMNMGLARGVYGAVLGPSYETPAEVRLLQSIGVDAVGMSTVPEVICARALGLPVLGFSMISNRAAGLGSEPLSHDEVVDVGRRAGQYLQRLLEAILPALASRLGSGLQ